MKKALLLLAVLLGALNASAIDYYLVGGFNGWTCGDPTCKFTDKGNGVYELKYNGSLTSGFKVNDGTWSNDNANFGSSGPALTLGEEYVLGVGGSTGNIDLAEGAVANPTLTLTISEYDGIIDATLKIVGEEAAVEITYCIHGCLTTTTWEDFPLTNTSGDIWETTVTVENPDAEFGIKQLTNGNQSAWLAANGDVTINGGGGGVLADSDPKNIKIKPGTYKLSFNIGAMSFSAAPASGIDSIEAAEVAPVYYNLQGVRVDNPTKGMFIEVRGAKVAKVMK